jgi:formimidoylglutamate deiminase
MSEPLLLWAPQAWLPHGWAQRVLLRTDTNGRWAEVTPGVATPPADATRLPGPVLPGLVNAHSHAFQRAFAGLAERRERAADDFWSWRDRMYRTALRITPAQLQAIGAQLYLELLQGGYTQVCEFHYLQHQPDGQPYPDPLTLGWALADAAQQVGLGLTLMPTLYERAGFTQPALRDDQRRFASTAASVHAQATAITQAARHGRPLLNAGLVLHSLRAAAPASIHTLAKLAEHFDGPLHIHVAEQAAEVDDCLAATGKRPIEWLVAEHLLDERWQLVHATHTQPGEIAAVAASGAGVVICPTTEANLGDGLPDLRGWLAAGVPLAIGSDSHATRCWREELRWLDYGQRLLLRQRNVAAAPDAGQPSTAERLWQRALAGGAAAAGQAQWGLQPGARADLLVADPHEPALLGVPASHTLDALVFSSPAHPWQDVMVAGQWQLRHGQHAQGVAIARAFEAEMAALWGEA